MIFFVPLKSVLSSEWRMVLVGGGGGGKIEAEGPLRSLLQSQGEVGGSWIMRWGSSQRKQGRGEQIQI